MDAVATKSGNFKSRKSEKQPKVKVSEDEAGPAAGGGEDEGAESVQPVGKSNDKTLSSTVRRRARKAAGDTSAPASPERPLRDASPSSPSPNRKTGGGGGGDGDDADTGFPATKEGAVLNDVPSKSSCSRMHGSFRFVCYPCSARHPLHYFKLITLFCSLAPPPLPPLTTPPY